MHENLGRDQFLVLFICTGNICRSRMAQQIFEGQTREQSHWLKTSSAGTRAVVGAPMTEQAISVSRSYGGVPDDNRGVQVTQALVRNADLILTAERVHRSEVVSLVPRASRVTFTLREFARLVATYSDLEPSGLETLKTGDGASRPNRMSEFVRLVGGMRGYETTRPSPEDDDIVDPFRRSQAVYDTAGDLINRSVLTIVGALLSALPPDIVSGSGLSAPSPMDASEGAGDSPIAREFQ